MALSCLAIRPISTLTSFHVEAGADHPPPWLEFAHVGEFGDDPVRVVLPLEQVVHVAGAVGLDHLDELLEQVLAHGIAEIGDRFAVQVRSVGVDDDVRGHVVDPEIVFVLRAVAEVLDHLHGLVLGLGAAEHTASLHFLVGGDHVPGDFCHFLEQFAFFGEQVFFERGEDDEEDGGDEQQDGEQGRQGDANGHRMHEFPFAFLVHARDRLGGAGCSGRGWAPGGVPVRVVVRRTGAGRPWGSIAACRAP